MGDPTRALFAKTMIEVMERDNLVASTASVGASVYSSLAALTGSGRAGANKIFNLRGEGEGTFIAWDLETPQLRDDFVMRMRKEGVNMGGCGERAVRLRPMLVFQQHHADILLEKTEKVLKEL
jgi:4-aminobutyrate aminotransferase/(S)-3-amino-2-methylpropionate transaminase